jgi:PAS domain S-box-containing protein
MPLLPGGHNYVERGTGGMQRQRNVAVPFWSKTRLGIKLLVIAFVPFVLSSICILATLSVLSDVQAEERTQQLARQITADCRNAEDAVVQAATLVSLYARTHNPALLDDYHHYADRSKKSLADLNSIVEDEAVKTRDLAQQLEELNGSICALTDQFLLREHQHIKRKTNLLVALKLREAAVDKFSNFKHLVDQLEESGAEIAKRRVHRSPLHYFLRDNMVLAIGTTLFVSFALAWFLSRSLVSRLRQLTDKAAQLALLKPPEAPQPGADEIARLDHVFTEMALRLLDAIKREQSAIACAADIILSIDGRGIIRSANPAVEQKCGWQTAQVEGLPVVDLVPEANRQQLHTALSSSGASRFEAPLLHHDGSISPCLWSTSWSQGQQAAIAVVHDVSERKKAEQALAETEARTRLFMQHMPAGLLLLTRDGLVRFANDTAIGICGLTEEKLVGSQFTDIISGSKFDTPRAFVELMSQRSRSVATAIAVAGEEKRLQLSVNAFGQQSGEDLFLAVLLDDTERSRFEELKQRLIAMLAHDMATPLVTVQSTLSMASSGMFGPLAPATAEKVDEAASESEHVLQVFKNMVRFQKLASGFSSLTASQMSLRDLTDQALDVVAETAAAKKLNLKNSVPAEIYCLGDADKLALLGATLLQSIVDSCKDKASIDLGSSHQTNLVSWTIAVDGLPDDLSSLRPYLGDESYIFAGAEPSPSPNLDLVLWGLLLYQCGGKVTCKRSDAMANIELILPCPADFVTTSVVDNGEDCG